MRIRRIETKGIYAISLLVLLAAVARGAEPYTSDPVWVSTPTNVTRSVAFGDVDGDGDLDLVYGNDGGPNALYLNQGGVFSLDATWQSQGDSSTYAVALGDINGDGAVDLVCGNNGQKNTVYLNAAGGFSDVAAWESAKRNATWAVALGDIDNDGDLDLVCGNNNQGNTVYLNTGGILSATPDWSSALALPTRSVALGDMDGNGYIDIVCGNDGERNTLYRNNAGVLSPDTAWLPPSNRTFSVVLGDVNGDGTLDVACGNANGSNTLYHNDGSNLSDSPDWSTTATDISTSVDLGDVDGDGDLDLVCGNYNQTNKLHLNMSGALADTVSWESGPPNRTFSAALGDTDGDGDLDLACGNDGEPNTLYAARGILVSDSHVDWSPAPDRSFGVAVGDVNGDGLLDVVFGNGGFIDSPNTLFLNTGARSPFENAPSWSSPARSTVGVALGDMDRDGDLDLICGNSGTAGQGNTLYLNDGGLFADTTAWESSNADFTFVVALGDLTGNGYLDLVCANRDSPNSVYRNDNGSISVTDLPFGPPGNSTVGVALGDVDGDGDLDVVCGNTGQPNALYRNDNGVIRQTPSWESADARETFGVALADVDGDGDLDLVCANDETDDRRNTLYLNLGGTFSSIPDWLEQEQRSSFAVALGDVDGDGDLDLVCGDGGTRPGSNTLYLNSGGAGVFSFLPDREIGFSPTFEVALGDVDADGDLDVVSANAGIAGEPNTIHRGARSPAFKGLPGAPANHTPNNGAMLRRVWTERLSANVLRVHFVAIDVEADSLWIVPEYQFKGDPETFAIGSGASVGPFPSSISGVSGHFDWDIFSVPFDSRDVTLRLQLVEVPRRVARVKHAARYLHDAGRIVPARPEIAAGDRLSFPTVVVGDTASAILSIGNVGTEPLDVFSIDLPSSEMSLDPTPTIPASIGAGAFIELSVRLHPVEDVTIVDSLRINSSDTRNPSHAVAIDTDIRWVAAVPQPSSGSDFLQGRDVRVALATQAQTIVGSAILYYRSGGDTAYAIDTVDVNVPIPTATIPGSAVGATGIEFWLSASTNAGGITDPPLDARRSPGAIRVTVTNLAEPGSHAGEQYRLLSFPLELQSPITGVITDDLGGPDDTKWRLWLWDAATRRHVQVPNASRTDFEHGRGYWLGTRNSYRLDTSPARGLSTPTSDDFVITLDPGYNLIGNPFNYDVSWASVRVDSPLVGPPVRFVSGAGYGGSYEYNVSVLKSFEGYWIDNGHDVPVSLRIPPTSTGSSGGTTSVASPEVVDGWTIRVAFEAGGARDDYNILGIQRGALSERDRYDRSEFPMGPGPMASLYFPHGQWSATVDMRGGYENNPSAFVAGTEVDAWGQMWSFDVALNFNVAGSGDTGRLAFDGVASVPDDAVVYLVDRQLKRLVDLREEPHYSFVALTSTPVTHPEDCRFSLIVGSESFLDAAELPTLPMKNALHQNYPNPFNPSTIIRYDVVSTGPVQIRVYDVRGALVNTLVDGPHEAGRHETAWSGENNRGERVASGVYFYRLTTAQFSRTRKMILLR